MQGIMKEEIEPHQNNIVCISFSGGDRGVGVDGGVGYVNLLTKVLYLEYAQCVFTYRSPCTYF